MGFEALSFLASYRRRKWLDQDTNEILTKTYSIAFEGTQLTKEFVSFLKEAYRAHVDDQTGEMVRQGVQDEAEVFQYCAADLHE